MIEPVLGARHKGAGLEVVGKQVLPLTPLGQFNTSPGERRGRQVDGVDQVIAHRPGTGQRHPFGRSQHDKRHMQSTFGRHLLVTDQVVSTVVREIDDDRRFQQAVCLETVQDTANDLVITTNGIVVLGHQFTVHLVLRVIGRNCHRGGVGFSRRGRAGRVRFATLELDLPKKRLSLGPFPPGSLVVLLRYLGIDSIARLGKVVVRLANIKGKVTRLSHQFSNRLHAGR